MESHRVYLLLGSNLGDRLRMLRRAMHKLEFTLGRLIATSSVYESEALGFDSKMKFLNQVLVFESKLPAEKVLSCILGIEDDLGRQRVPGTISDRTVDIDILFYDDLVIDQLALILPHPRMLMRRFVMLPLAEIAPEVIHPQVGKTILQLLDECPDNSEVSVYHYLESDTS